MYSSAPRPGAKSIATPSGLLEAFAASSAAMSEPGSAVPSAAQLRALVTVIASGAAWAAIGATRMSEAEATSVAVSAAPALRVDEPRFEPIVMLFPSDNRRDPAAAGRPTGVMAHGAIRTGLRSLI